MESSQQFQENFEGFKRFIKNPTILNLSGLDWYPEDFDSDAVPREFIYGMFDLKKKGIVDPKIDLDKIEERDREFVRRLLVLTPVDPELLKRVILIRTKLSNEIDITNAEADEIINRLQAKYFSHDLCLSGMKFDELKMDKVFVGGSLFMKGAVVRGDNNRRGMEVVGDIDERGMKVEGTNNQEEMEVRGKVITS